MRLSGRASWLGLAFLLVAVLRFLYGNGVLT